MVVVVGEDLDDARRAGELDVRADKDPHRARHHEPVDEILREPTIDLVGATGRALASVTAGVVDLDVEANLVRDVTEAAEARAEAELRGGRPCRP